MLTGRFEADSKGFRIRTVDTMHTEPSIVTSIWRVTAINGEPAEDGTLAIYRSGRWDVGTRCSCATGEKPESFEKAPLMPPRGKRGKVEWRDGEWKPKRAWIDTPNPE